MGDELMDAPNQQAVGLDPPWVEGTGGSAEEPEPKKASRAKAKKEDPEPDDDGDDEG